MTHKTKLTPTFIKFPEPRTQTQDRSVRDDSDTRARGVGGLPSHGAQATVVQHRRCAGATRLAQAHTAPLSAAVTALQAAQTGRPAQLSF